MENSINAEDVNKILASLEADGREVNHSLAWEIYKEYYKGHPFQSSKEEIISQFTAALWIHNAVA